MYKLHVILCFVLVMEYIRGSDTNKKKHGITYLASIQLCYFHHFGLILVSFGVSTIKINLVKLTFSDGNFL